MRTYSHLTLEERERLYAGIESGKSLREIAKELGRDHSTLSRELRRNAKYGKPYIPCKAQEKTDKRAKEQRRKAPLKNPLVFVYVRQKLRKGLSPEQIAGRLSIDHPGYTIDDETIYRYIYAKQNRREKLWRHLPLARKKRRKKQGRKVKKRGKIPNAVPIDKRPKEVEKRKTVGHWETDNMEGKRSDQSVVSVTAERLARLVFLTKLKDRKAATKRKALTSRFGDLPPRARLTLTADNGPENSEHEEITATLSLPVFFCHPYHAWEKGTVENTIKRVRRFVPKGTSIDDLPEEKLAAIEHHLNNTPRKCLGFLTPYEKMEELLALK